MGAVIGITGGIGAGKSYVSRLLTEHFGIPVFNCDIEARRLTLLSPDIHDALCALVSPDVYLPDGNVNKPLLADFMFNQGRAAEVNAIIHPAVRDWFAEWRSVFGTSTMLRDALALSKDSKTQKLKDSKTQRLALESAILIESGFTDLCDEVWLVTAPLQLRIERAMARDHATRQQVEARIRAQLSDSARLPHARHVIVNDGAAPLIPQIERILSL